MDEKSGNGWTALCNAAWSGHLEVVKVLVQAAAGVHVANNSGDTPLHMAANRGHHEVCKKYLIEDGKASINKANKYGNTALKWATLNNRTAFIAYLESKG